MNLAPDDVAYLQQKAGQIGYNADDLMRVINYESSGDPGRWGGKGGNYFGLIQFGPNERKQFGVDTQNPNAKNQIDATFNFLASRGFKPGMPLIDLYSTINAGSPGHYNASDGNGTVASHVSKMMGGSVPGPSATDRQALTGLFNAISQPEGVTGSVSTMPQGLLSLTSGSDNIAGGLPNMSRGIKPVSAEEEDMPAGKMVQHLGGEAHRPTKEQINKLRKRGLLG